jgi:hypothetical protein
MKHSSDSKRSARSFQVGEMVLLQLQPYAQTYVVNMPCPKLAMKFFGPYKVLEKIGTSVYKLELPDNSRVHPNFHVSQLKQFTVDYSLAFKPLPHPPQLDLQDLELELILDRRLSKKGNTAIT